MGIKVSICVTAAAAATVGNNNNGEYEGVVGGGEERTRAEEIISERFFPSFDCHNSPANHHNSFTKLPSSFLLHTMKYRVIVVSGGSGNYYFIPNENC